MLAGGDDDHLDRHPGVGEAGLEGALDVAEVVDPGEAREAEEAGDEVDLMHAPRVPRRRSRDRPSSSLLGGAGRRQPGMGGLQRKRRTSRPISVHWRGVMSQPSKSSRSPSSKQG